MNLIDCWLMENLLLFENSLLEFLVVMSRALLVKIFSNTDGKMLRNLYIKIGISSCINFELSANWFSYCDRFELF